MEDRSCEEVDTNLITAFYHGEDGAFDALVERWWPRLHGFFRRWGFDHQTAEDLVQVVLVDLFVTRDRAPGHGRFDLAQPLAPFVFRIARNRAIQDGRRNRPERKTFPLNEELDIPAPDCEAESAILTDLLACVDGLPVREFEYIQMCSKHGLGDLSHNEIAEILGKFPSQVTRISQRALLLVRNCMDTKGY